MADATDDTLATSPKDPLTGQVRPSPGSSERPGTEAEEAPGKRAPPKPQGEGPPAGEANRAFPDDGG